MLSASLLLSTCFASAVFAADTPYVYDQGNLFSYSEADEISEKIESLTDSCDMTFAVVTTLDAEGKSAQEYADDFYDEHGLGVGDDYSGQYNYSSETGEIDPYEEEENLTIVALIFGMIVGLITALIKFFRTKSSYQLTIKTYHYPLAEKSTLDLTTKEDRLVNQFITHRKIPKNPPPSSSGNPGRSTTHVSSSGRTHGGGGRKL